MPIVQFRVHPSVGIARMGNSGEAYYLASEFPYFMQELFPNLRLAPKPRTHPIAFFGGDPTLDIGPGHLPTYEIFNTTTATANKFKDNGDASATPPVKPRILPQAARFRVFGYVYDTEGSRWPSKVFEVTTADANIKWKVNLANKKSQKTGVVPPDENSVATATELDTTGGGLLAKRHRKPGFPNLAYLFLERDEADKTKVTGRLHVIGNEGEMQGSVAPAATLWSNDWYDSEGDGPVEAIVTPINGGAEIRAKAGAISVGDLKYLDQDQTGLKPGSLGSINAAPAWVVVGVPDYSPDMGHFVSVWDIALNQAIWNVEKTVSQPGKHKLIRNKDNTKTYKRTDYFIHIHPHLCLFKDVRSVSGDAFGGDTEHGEHLNRGHYKHPGGTPPTGPLRDPLRDAKVEFGGITLDARTRLTDLSDHTKLKDKDSSKPIDEWFKIAVFMRLRLPGTVYEPRKFLVKLPSGTEAAELKPFPRRYGRRHDYDKTAGPGNDKNKMYESASEDFHNGSLRDFHGLKDHGKLCGGPKSPPDADVFPPGFDKDRLALLDDHFWPATARDMPLLRELALTQLQFDSFKAWQGADAEEHVFEAILPSSLRASFGTAKEADAHFAELMLEAPIIAPTIIDMAHTGTMLGGSFLAGIEVGREAGVSTNWSLFEGATRFFPDVRFKPMLTTKAHTVGTLTKDLAIPWSFDYQACEELYWPTARPGMVLTSLTTQVRWLPSRAQLATFLGVAVTPVDFVKEYWKALGFIRRNASDEFIEQEGWRP